ncbi:hypothetical protein EVAR_95281_1 [Eumeta japonica]|uniref:Uncharacterized protein n=1 Tax=Eumeta variegata TaxID=151549 RepID=A0A4C1UKB8_EUMVA|nr:hypothetical protein EVAR_95281_1 [Eumeta japonica]
MNLYNLVLAHLGLPEDLKKSTQLAPATCCRPPAIDYSVQRLLRFDPVTRAFRQCSFFPPRRQVEALIKGTCCAKNACERDASISGRIHRVRQKETEAI